MVKDETIELRYKIKSTSEVLRTESPTKIARAILDGLNPPDLTEKALVCRIQRLMVRKKNENGWDLARKPGSGRPRTVLTPVGLGRIKKMRKKSCRQIQSYTFGSPASTISRSSAHRGKKQVALTFFKYQVASQS